VTWSGIQPAAGETKDRKLSRRRLGGMFAVLTSQDAGWRGSTQPGPGVRQPAGSDNERDIEIGFAGVKIDTKLQRRV